MDKVVYLLVPSLVRHGMEKMAVLASEVLSSQYNVKLIIFNEDPESYVTNCQVINMGIPVANSRIGKLINIFKRSRILKKMRMIDNPKAVISFGPSANYVNILSRGIGKSIISYRGFASVSKRLDMKYCCRKADKIFGISQDLTDRIIELYPWTREKTYVVYNSVNVDEIQKKAQNQTDYSPSHPAFVAIGRLEPVKGYNHLICAFEKVSHEIPTASLTFIGDGSLRSDLERQVKSLGIEEKVHFLGNQLNPYKFMAKCDICTQTSIAEGFMNVLVESFACNIPAIATNCRSGPNEIICKNLPKVNDDYIVGDYGILTPSFSSNESLEPDRDIVFSKAMLELATNQQLYEKYVSVVSARAWDFSPQKYYQALVSLVEED